MKNKLFLIIIIPALLGGIFLSMLNDYYPFIYLYNIIFDHHLKINPKVQINPERKYQIKIWYYPLLRTAEGDLTMEEFLLTFKEELEKRYSNIELHFKELSFREGREDLLSAVREGYGPDIYFNIDQDLYLDCNYQIPVEWYINEQEKEGYLVVNWAEIGYQNHLWGFPFLNEKIIWIANNNLNNEYEIDTNILKNEEKLEQEKLFLNIYDPLLLRQLLSLNGRKKIEINENQISTEDRGYLRDIFSSLKKLKEVGVLIDPTSHNLLSLFINEEKIIVGPVNPWLRLYLDNNQIEYTEITAGNLIKTYSLNIFKQKNYQGDDHTKAVMETAKLFSQKYSSTLAEKLKLEAGYRSSYISKKTGELLPQLNPGAQQYWQEVILPVWIDFWEKDLTVEEVMKRL